MAFEEFETDSEKFVLNAINVLLQTINELPIENEEDLDNVLEAQTARQVLKETKEEVLSEDWHFNRDREYTLSPNTDGFIIVPFNILDLSSSDADLIVREWKLYSKSNQSFIFEDPQTVDIVWNIAFNDLTHPLRNYITVAAARKFQARQIMDMATYNFTEKDEVKARMIARRSDDRSSRGNSDQGEYANNYLVGGL